MQALRSTERAGHPRLDVSTRVRPSRPAWARPWFDRSTVGWPSCWDWRPTHPRATARVRGRGRGGRCGPAGAARLSGCCGASRPGPDPAAHVVTGVTGEQFVSETAVPRLGARRTACAVPPPTWSAPSEPSGLPASGQHTPRARGRFGGPDRRRGAGVPPPAVRRRPSKRRSTSAARTIRQTAFWRSSRRHSSVRRVRPHLADALRSICRRGSPERALRGHA